MLKFYIHKFVYNLSVLNFQEEIVAIRLKTLVQRSLIPLYRQSRSCLHLSDWRKKATEVVRACRLYWLRRKCFKKYLVGTFTEHKPLETLVTN